MKIKAEKSELQEKLGDIRGVVESKQAMPVLGHILLVATKEGACIQATNLEMYLREPLECTEVVEEGRMCIPGRKLFEIVKELEGEIVLESEEEGWLRVKSGASNFKVACLPAADFPAFPEVASVASIEIEAAALSEMIEKTAFAAADNDSRYVMNGLFFEVRVSDSEKKLAVVGTDGHRMAITNNTVTSDLTADVKAIVAKRTMNEMRKFLDIDGTVSVSLGERHAAFSLGNVDFVARLIEGTYPNYIQVIPKNEQEFYASREGLSKAVKRVALLANDKRTVMFEIGSDVTAISSTSPNLGDARDEISTRYSGGDLALGLNSEYLLEGLSAIGGEEVKLELGGSLSPIAMKSPADESFLYIVMPIRV